jgi:hypothetical protein
MCTMQAVSCPACTESLTLPPGYPGDYNDCPKCGYSWKPGPVLTVYEDGNEYHPAEYAAFWGDGSNADGCAYYNVSRQARPGVVIANPDLTPDDWRNFARIVRADLARVRSAIATEEGRTATGWSVEDSGNLSRLAEWADARAKGPQMFTYMDGESGAELVRMSEATAYGCSGSGSQDANVAANMGAVEWLADAATIRKHLKGYGSWDADELADDESNKERCLWLAAADISERAESYAD